MAYLLYNDIQIVLCKAVTKCILVLVSNVSQKFNLFELLTRKVTLDVLINYQNINTELNTEYSIEQKKCSSLKLITVTLPVGLHLIYLACLWFTKYIYPF